MRVGCSHPPNGASRRCDLRFKTPHPHPRAPLARLGLSLEAALDKASEAPLTPPLLDAWLAAERQRQAAQWAPRRAEAAAREQAEEEDEEAAALRTVAWRHVRRLLWRFGGCRADAARMRPGGASSVTRFQPQQAPSNPQTRTCLARAESAPARQQLLAGCLRLLGAPLPGALPSNSPAAAATSGDPDELWRAAALAGCHPAGSGSGGCLSSAAGPWAAELLARGDWGWLVGAGGAPAEPRTLRQQPWYRADPSRQAMLEHLLAALVRGPCRQDALVAAALVAVAAEGGSGGAGKPLDHARTLAKQLLAEQRSNLLLWQARRCKAGRASVVGRLQRMLPGSQAARQNRPCALHVPVCPSFRAAAPSVLPHLPYCPTWRACLTRRLQAYAQLELAAGNAKAARKVYQTCFATVGAPAGLAAASAAAPLVLGAARLELQQGSPAGPEAAPPALPSPVDAAPSGGGGGGLLPTAVAAASDAAAAAAARQLAWLGSGGAVALPAGGGGLAAVAPLQDEVVAAKRGFQDHLLAVVQQQQQRAAAGAAAGPAQASAGLSAGVRGLIAAAAAFELVLGRLRGSLAAGVKAALAIYDQVLAALLPDQAGGPQAGAAELADAQLELLSWQRCALAADAARRAVPGAPPAAAREALLRMLRRFPGSPPLLQLLVAHEMAGHTLTQLRRELGGLLEVAPSPQVRVLPHAWLLNDGWPHRGATASLPGLARLCLPAWLSAAVQGCSHSRHLLRTRHSLPSHAPLGRSGWPCSQRRWAAARPAPPLLPRWSERCRTPLAAPAPCSGAASCALRRTAAGTRLCAGGRGEAGRRLWRAAGWPLLCALPPPLPATVCLLSAMHGLCGRMGLRRKLAAIG